MLAVSSHLLAQTMICLFNWKKACTLSLLLIGLSAIAFNPYTHHNNSVLHYFTHSSLHRFDFSALTFQLKSLQRGVVLQAFSNRLCTHIFDIVTCNGITPIVPLYCPRTIMDNLHLIIQTWTGSIFYFSTTGLMDEMNSNASNEQRNQNS
jgi:hypothetical protein